MRNLGKFAIIYPPIWLVPTLILLRRDVLKPTVFVKQFRNSKLMINYS